MRKRDDCIFCKIAAGEIPSLKVYEDDRVLGFMDIMPLSKGHLLVIPKEHFESIGEIDPELYGHIALTICRLSRAVQESFAPDGLNVQQLNGEAANQVVPHVHMHLVPRWRGDGITISDWEPVPGEMEEIAANAEEIKSRL